MYAVTALSADDIWAVGYYTKHREALIEQWNGASWKLVPNALPHASCHPSLSGVTALSASSVWAVGYDWSNCDSPPYPLIEYWNGSEWHVAYNPFGPGALNGVAVASASNAWAVGELGYTRPPYAVTYHWDGTHWSNVVNPISSKTSNLSGIAVTSAGTFWAVGGYSQPNSNSRTLIEYYC